LRYRLEKIQPKDFLRWREEAWFAPLFYTVREYQVYTRMGGSTLYSIQLGFYGPLAPLVGLFFRRAVLDGLREEADALKTYCEKYFFLPAEEVSVDYRMMDMDNPNRNELQTD
jgi:hypothetical protein